MTVFNKTHTFIIVLLMTLIAGVCGLFIAEKQINRSASRLSHEQYSFEENTLQTRLRSEGAESAFKYLRSKLADDPAFAHDCHRLMHGLGRDAVLYYGDFSKALLYQDEICNSGYIHGVIEGQFLSISDIRQAVLATCSTVKPSSFEAWQCFHGIGHGVMYKTDKNLSTSLSACEYLTDTFSRMACANGVFMERFIINGHDGNQVSGVMPTMSSCNQQSEIYKAICYTYAPTALLEVNDSDYKEAINACQKAEKDYVGVCVAGVGSQVMKDNIGNPTTSAKTCKHAGQLRNSCAIGAISLFINHYADTSKAAGLCSQEFAEYKQSCETIIKAKQEQYGI